MIFSSLVFLCIFLPTVFVLYTIIPNIKVRNGLLIVASLIFYAYGEPIYVLLMIFSSILNYLCALWVAKDKEKSNKLALVVAVVVNLGILCVFKYTGMIVTSINSVFSLGISVPQITLPIGISFFTFQALSYVIDVYRHVVEKQKNYFNILLYIAFFPQLIAGPIVKYRDINDQINNRVQTLEKVARGFRRFICGLGKKVIIANTVGEVADVMFNSNTEVSILTAWLGAICYLFQIYYDFDGYSDMAIGLGMMFGFEFKENFNYPYGAFSVQDFWRKWHISLSTWFKEYLYIPLGGNRKGKARTALNKIIVFFFTGLWHGANWTFVVWGLFHGFFLLLEEYVPVLRKLPKAIGRIYTLLVVTVGFVIFRADTISQGISYIGSMFSGFNFTSASNSLFVEQMTPWFIVIFIVAIIGCAPIRPLSEKIKANLYGEGTLTGKWKVVQVVLYVLAFALLVFCIIRLPSASYNPFIYFRF